MHTIKKRREMKLVTLLLCVFALTGCSGYGVKPEMSDFSQMKLDCSHQDAQIEYLRSQLTTPDERIIQVFNWFGDQERRHAVLSREYDANILAKIDTLEITCPQ